MRRRCRAGTLQSSRAVYRGPAHPVYSGPSTPQCCEQTLGNSLRQTQSTAALPTQSTAGGRPPCACGPQRRQQRGAEARLGRAVGAPDLSMVDLFAFESSAFRSPSAGPRRRRGGACRPSVALDSRCTLGLGADPASASSPRIRYGRPYRRYGMAVRVHMAVHTAPRQIWIRTEGAGCRLRLRILSALSQRASQLGGRAAGCAPPPPGRPLSRLGLSR
jgi:hypothetical protein